MPKVIDSRITWKLSCGHVCKMFVRQWTNEAKIAIFNDPTLIWRPLSSEPCEYLHKPYTARNYVPWTFPGLRFCRWQYMGSSANFRTLLSESRRHQHISCRARNSFNAKWPINVIEGRITSIGIAFLWYPWSTFNLSRSPKMDKYSCCTEHCISHIRQI